MFCHMWPNYQSGFGGSMTNETAGVGTGCQRKSGVVLDHGQPGLTRKRMEIMRQEVVSDLFLCSANAITLDGYLVM